jgi:DNA mismatch repair ATPase MutS
VIAFEKIINPQEEGFNLTRRQTLKTAQRYSSPYLSGLETEVLQAKQQLIHEEKKIITTLIESLDSLHQIFSECNDSLAKLDIYTSHALFAHQQKLISPSFSNT